MLFADGDGTAALILADDTAEGVFWDVWHFSLCDDACTIHAGIINTTVYQGAPGRVSRGGLPLPTVTMDTKPSEGAEGGGGGDDGSELKPVSNWEHPVLPRVCSGTRIGCLALAATNQRPLDAVAWYTHSLSADVRALC